MTLSDQVTYDGTMHIEIEADIADALAFDATIGQIATGLDALGDTDTLDVRRSRAVGVIADPQAALDLLAGQPAGKPARGLLLHVHLHRDALTAGTPLGRVEGYGAVLADQVRDWVGRDDLSIRLQPVVDLDREVRVDAYEVPDRIREHDALRDVTCVFPWCERDARGCDDDHVVAAADGGETSTANTAPLCRRHHRAKTHGRWSYAVVEPGTYLWRSPLGHAYVRDAARTSPLTGRTPDG